jgi:hypothetical protein
MTHMAAVPLSVASVERRASTHGAAVEASLDRIAAAVRDRAPLVRPRALESDVYDPLEYRFDDIDVVLVEGILLFQSRFDERYDLRVWVECSFATALQRALERNAERLPKHRLREDYERIYHAAQRHHFAVDAPQRRADYTILNDDRLQQPRLEPTCSNHDLADLQQSRPAPTG